MDSNRDSALIYFHIGLGKAASTYLQKKVFPHLQGIFYVHRNRFRQRHRIMARNSGAKFLLSREAGSNFENRLRRAAESDPQARIIIVLRQHRSLLASQYRRYVKNGGALPFSQYVDVEGDSGVWTSEDVFYLPKLRLIERYFGHRPLVLFYEDLRADAYGFVDELCTHLGTSYDRKSISLDAYHTSYSEKQLILMRRFGSALLKRWPQQTRSGGFANWINRRCRLHVCHLLLFLFRLVPQPVVRRLVESAPLISNADLNRIDSHCATDWKQCREYARQGGVWAVVKSTK